ncbi:MAG: hypothetical protein A2087_08940 [Spirochaetes bacterium GWD1_61_31]|nr:MAG: hypothetical protein A2Y37_13435 [Spirochaetes bacterium GWB1_60_80]OHD42559.1 MAG: hypothetical protein A2087_08940 [Spirochaetes bacterium GWD1_61_31]OHD45055.1 MAG: hypothetical protein A2Y35_12655 [Spirochaetes bacterium GWE1_60_18]
MGGAAFYGGDHQLGCLGWTGTYQIGAAQSSAEQTNLLAALGGRTGADIKQYKTESLFCQPLTGLVHLGGALRLVTIRQDQTVVVMIFWLLIYDQYSLHVPIVRVIERDT